MADVCVAPATDLSAATLARLRPLLDAAFPGDFSDDDWAHALGGVHVWIEVDGEPISHASVVTRRIECDGQVLDVGYVEAVATAAANRRCGYGSAVMARINTIIRDRFVIGLLSTGTHTFYERLGWQRWTGPTFVDAPDGRRATPGDDGDVMLLPTPRTPSLNLDGPIVCDWRAGDVW